MKKRIITLLAVLAVLVACTVIAVQATVDTSGDWKCPCCNKAYGDITWITYGSATSYGFGTTNADGRHYLINGDYKGNLGGNLNIDGTKSEKIVILFGKASGELVFGTAKGSKLFTIKNGAKVYMIGDGKSTIFSAGYSSTSDTTNGAVITVDAGGELHMTNMKLAMQLGNKGSGQLTTLGSVTSGGLIVNAGTTTMTNCTLNGSAVNATKFGGAIYNEGTMTVTGGSITGGTVGSQGGAIYNIDTMTLTDVQISGGNATSHGGTIAMNAADAVMTIDGTTIVTAGVTAARGAAIYLGAGQLNIGGNATINAATTTAAASMYRGIYMLNAGGTCNLYGNAVVNSSGLGAGDGVGVMYGVLTLSGNARVVNSANPYARCIYRWKGGSGIVQVDRDWTGEASINWEGITLENHGGFVANTGILWGNIDDDFVFTANTTAESGAASNLRLEYDSHDNPQLFFFNSEKDGNGFVTPRAQVFADGVSTWYLTLVDAVYGYIGAKANTKYIKMWTNSSVNLNNTFYIDFNGYDSTATKGEKGKIYAFDSTAKAGEAGAKLKFDAEPITVINGKTYVCNEATIYPVEYKITNVSLRPSATAASLYYTASVKAHADAGLKNWGVAVSINPDAGATLADYMYTQTSEVAEDNAYNGVLIKDIAKNGSEKNAEYAAKAIYAKAYLTLADGTVVFSAAADKDLTEIITAVEAQDQSAMTEAQKTAIADMQASAWYADIFGAPEA